VLSAALRDPKARKVKFRETVRVFSIAQGSPPMGANLSKYLPIKNPSIARSISSDRYIFDSIVFCPPPRDISGRKPMDLRRVCFTSSLSDPFLLVPHSSHRMLRTFCNSHSTDSDYNSLERIPEWDLLVLSLLGKQPPSTQDGGRYSNNWKTAARRFSTI